MTNYYDYITHDGKKLQTESAIRDGNGYNISDTYAKKIREVLVTCGESTHTITISHEMEMIPSTVEMFIKYANDERWARFDADVSVTTGTIVVALSVSPPNGTQILIKITI